MNDKVHQLQPQQGKTFSLTPSNLDEAMKFSKMIADSDICPKDFKGKEGNVLVAVQMGAELGIPPLQALQNIAVINGRPSVWGDALPALARNHPKFVYIDEKFDDQTMTATCKIKRKGEPEQIFTFSKDDAIKANLWNKEGTWQKYPKRMLKMRARAWAIRDVFSDALKGINVAEEVMDYDEPKDMGNAERVTESEDSKSEQILLPNYPSEHFDLHFQKYQEAIQSGMSPDSVIAKIETKYTLSEDQKKKIKAVTNKPGQADQSSQEPDGWDRDYDKTAQAEKENQQ